jgi:signal transduction histidine kinase
MDAMRPVVDKKGLAMEKISDDGAIRVLVDRGRMIQVLMNLIDNAIKFTFPGGRIIVSSKTEGRYLSISVADTGVGIEQIELKRIFEKFEQIRTAAPGVEFRGTGLGLAISKEIVESHQGSIWAESRVGEGSQFSFTLPLYD